MNASANIQGPSLVKSIRKVIARTYFEGSLYAIMAGGAESFALYYAVKRNFTLEQIALLTTLPVVLGSLAQIGVPYFVKTREKLSFALKSSFFIQILGLALMVYTCFLPNDTAYLTLLTSLSFYWIGGLCANPLWLDWISGFVPPNTMHNFLSRRNAFISIVTLAAYILTAYVLNSKTLSDSFVYVFFAALTARSLGLSFQWKLSKINPIFTEKVEKESKPRGIPLKRAVYIAIFGSFLFRSMVFVASPFFLPYMIGEMKLSLMEYSVLTALPFIGRFLFLAGWGQASINLKLFIGLELACFGLALSPLTWVISNSLYIIGISQLIIGLLWGGYEISQVLIIQKYWPGSTLKMLGFHLALSNIGSVVGAWLGAKYLNIIGSYHDLFVLSMQLRILAALIMFYGFLQLKETRFRSKAYTDFLFASLSLRPTADFLGRLVFVRKRKSPVIHGRHNSDS